MMWTILALYFVNMTYLWTIAASIEILSKDKLDIKLMNFYHKPCLVLLDSLVKRVEATDGSSCQIHCVNHESCLSVNFGKKSNQTFCELNNSTSLASSFLLCLIASYYFICLLVSKQRRRRCTNNYIYLEFSRGFLVS